MIDITMLIVTRNSSKYIKSSIESLIKQGYKKEEYEIIIVDGMSDDDTVEIAKNYLNSQNINYKIIKNPSKTLAAGWNLGIKNSQGKYIVRVDAHAELLDSYVKIGVKKLQSDKNIGAVGGVLITKSQNYLGKMIAKVLSNPIGVGNSLFRIGIKKDVFTDTAVYAVYKKEVFKKIGLFNENLDRNQDIDLHKRMLKKGYKILTTPQMRAVYYNRTTMKKFIEQAFKNGFWVVYGKSGHFRHLAPLFFVLGILLSFLIPQLTLLLVSFYTIVVILFYIFKSQEKNILNLIVLSILTFLLHISYGIGSIFGFFKLIEEKIKAVL